MSLDYRQRYQLRLVRADVSRSDPLLCSMFGMFGRLYRGADMPAWEQVPTRRDHGRIAAWGLAGLAVGVALFGAVLTAALVTVAAVRTASAPFFRRRATELSRRRCDARRTGWFGSR